jgi:PEP-CTERM motif
MKTNTKGKANWAVKVIFGVALAVAQLGTTAQAITIYSVADYPISPYTGGIAGFGSGPFNPAQTFTALGSGELQDITIALAADGPITTVPNNVVVEFRSTVNGTPSSTVLASADINGSLLANIEPGSPVMLSADFSTYQINLVSGSVYAFSLQTDTGYAFGCGSGNNYLYNYTGGSLFASYDSGTTWSAQSLYSMNFEVTASPEPSTIALVGIGALANCLLARSRQRVNEKHVF